MKSVLLLIVVFSILFADLSRDDATDIVTDNATESQWQDNTEASSILFIWSAAIDQCEALRLGDLTDWRLPNINELRSIVDFRYIDPASDPVFLNSVPEPYWSSTSDDDIYTSHAWMVDFYDGSRMGSLNASGGVTQISKHHNANVRCVRRGK